MIIDVCLVCANDISREGLGRILETDGFQVTGSFRRIAELEGESFREDCLYLIDSNDPRQLLEGVELVTRGSPEFKAVVLSEAFELRSMLDCFQAGGFGYLVKSNDSRPLTASLRLAAAGRKVPPSEIIELLDRESISSLLAAETEEDFKQVKLSPRELDVLCCLMAGYSNKAIARNLDVCEATVKVHVKAILRKLNVRNRTQAAIWANAHRVAEFSTVGASASRA